MSVTRDNASTHLKRIGYGNTFASNVVLVREALERGITVTKSERFNDIQLDFEGKTHRWRNGRNTLNTILAKRVTRYKDVTSALLRSQGVNAAENIVADPREADRAWAWAQPLGATLFKSNTQRIGTGCHYTVAEEDDFRRRLDHFSDSRDKAVLIEKVYRGEAHRCFIVNGTVIAALQLRPASVLGNGVSTISELVTEKNRKRRNLGPHRNMRLDAEELAFLTSQGLTTDSIPAEGERVTLTQISSPRGGGDAIDATDSLTIAQTEFVQSVVEVIPGLSIAEVDVMFDAEGEPDSLVILEVNPAPRIALYHHPWEGEPRDAASAVLNAMFPNS